MIDGTEYWSLLRISRGSKTDDNTANLQVEWRCGNKRLEYCWSAFEFIEQDTELEARYTRPMRLKPVDGMNAVGDYLFGEGSINKRAVAYLEPGLLQQRAG